MKRRKTPAEQRWLDLIKALSRPARFPGFPGAVAEATILLEERTPGIPGSATFSMDHRDYRTYRRCGNPSCIHGGYKIGAFVEEVVAGRRLDAAREFPCEGHERRRGTSGGRKCPNIMTVQVRVRYEV